jgi:hypothetical protein
LAACAPPDACTTFNCIVSSLLRMSMLSIVFCPAFSLPTLHAPHLFSPRASVRAPNLNICRTLISARLQRRGIADMAETPIGCSKGGRRGPIPLLRMHGCMRARVYDCMRARAPWRKHTPHKKRHADRCTHARMHACVRAERARARERETDAHTDAHGRAYAHHLLKDENSRI